MSRIENTVDRITRYLKGLLSNRERHNLEKEMMQDRFDEEAFEGLTQLTGTALEADMEAMMHRLDQRISGSGRRIAPWIFKMAAALVLLLGIGSALFLLFRTPDAELISRQEKRTEQKAPAETAIPKAITPQAKQEVTENKPAEVPEKSDTRPVINVDAETALMEYESLEDAIVTIDSAAFPSAEITAQYTEPSVPVYHSTRSAEKAKMIPHADPHQRTVITGRVVGIDGQAIPGVTIMEKGTSRGTVTNTDGKFSLQVEDTGSMLALSSVGFKPAEITGNEAATKEITLVEDVVALNEVVVVGYGTEKRTNVTGAVSTVKGEEISGVPEPGNYSYTKPLPPGGSVKSFKEKVEKLVDIQKFSNLKGKYRFQVNLTVHNNGTISNISIPDKIPEEIAGEYKRVIASIEGWQPAVENTLPVEETIGVRFTVTVE